ncbi:class I SAM-dependent methyltransferase [Polyangium sp. 15x6]|uniref:class I SAM-dependent methyltransferase n=1 Tax=Polyangium sp. 15x6 TaxID=3042687 RepID=UPI00249B0039|nr:class I SAM-dependent methyltransferase [Polyangium sp. 15x6]MDI3288739.1 class I SAM-dependent methyltransferase [Polyangium sp. 15x6]
MADADRQKWDARYAAEGAPEEPSAWLMSLDGHLPREGRALDVGGGAGRNAVWLAKRGLRVTLVDISPVGLSVAEERGREAGVTIETLRRDLEEEPLPEGPWDVILQSHYLERPLFRRYPRLLAPNGLLVVEHPTRSNLLRHARPGAAFLLEDGELPSLCAGLSMVRYEEGWTEQGRHEARCLARRVADGDGGG